MTTIVEMPLKKVLSNSLQIIEVKEEIWDWLHGNVGWGDHLWWDEDSLANHIEHCTDGLYCRESCGYRCNGEVWGWTYPLGAEKSQTVRFYFREAKFATLFKLVWA